MWDIDGEKSQSHQYPTTDGEKDPENKWHEIRIQTLGYEPIKVNEGQKIHCCMKISHDDGRRTWYGHDGGRNRYS